MSSSSSCDPDWADLPSDLWAAISGKHLNSIPDYLSFRGVCRSWRSIATLENFDATPSCRVPWLMYVSNVEGKKRVKSMHQKQRREFANLFDLSTNKVHKTINNFYPADCKRYPSSQGWILCVSDVNREVYLTHPISRARIELPGSDTFPEDLFVGKMVLSCNPATAMKKKNINDDLVVMVIWSKGMYSNFFEERLGFSRPGDSSWTVMDGQFLDILYHNGKLYAVAHDSNVPNNNSNNNNNNNNNNNKVVEFDIHAPNPLTHQHVFSLPCSASGIDAREAARAAIFADPNFVVNDDDDYFDFGDPPTIRFENKYYLLESCGKFIIVIRHTLEDVTFWFEVFEFDVDFKDGRISSHSCREIKQHDHWNKTLFLGFDSSVICSCVEFDDDVVVKPNCIYFTDDKYWETRNVAFDMGEFCLLTRLLTTGILDGFSDFSLFVTPPTWVVPTFGFHE